MKVDASRVRVKVEPSEEPITVEEAKLHLRIDHNDEDTLINELIIAARIHCEDIARRAFVTRTYTVDLDAWPWDNVITFPYPPMIAVVAITYIDEEGNDSVFAPSNYLVDAPKERIVLRRNAMWPSVTLQEVAGVSVEWTAGYGDAESVPVTYKAAIKLVLADLYENREAVNAAQGLTVTPNPTLDRLLLIDRGY